MRGRSLRSLGNEDKRRETLVGPGKREEEKSKIKTEEISKQGRGNKIKEKLMKISTIRMKTQAVEEKEGRVEVKWTSEQEQLS